MSKMSVKRKLLEAEPMFFLDLDGFTSVNDVLSTPPVSESCRERCGAPRRARSGLTNSSGRLGRPCELSQNAVTGDTAARLGGDEFVVLCEDTDAVHAAIVRDRLRSAAAEPFAVAGRQVGLTAAVGVIVHDSATGGAGAAGPTPEAAATS
jgi:predicted signal transduction protein with EAL and GGDEF domain